MKKNLLFLLSVFVGFIVASLLSSSTTYLLKTYVDVAAQDYQPLYYKIFDLSYAIFYLGVGGYVSVVISKNLYSSIVLGIISLVLSVITLTFGFDTVNAVWYQMAYAILSIPAAYLGGYISLEKSIFRNIQVRSQ